MKRLSFIAIFEVFVRLFLERNKTSSYSDSFRDSMLARNQSTRCFNSKLTTDSIVPIFFLRENINWYRLERE